MLLCLLEHSYRKKLYLESSNLPRLILDLQNFSKMTICLEDFMKLHVKRQNEAIFRFLKGYCLFDK